MVERLNWAAKLWLAGVGIGVVVALALSVVS